MSSDTFRWGTDELREAARTAMLHDARIYNVAYRAACVTVPHDNSGNESLVRALREVAMQAAATALLIAQRGEDD